MAMRSVAVLTMVLALSVPASAGAQQWLEVRATPRLGLMTPADWFYVEFPVFGVQPMVWTEAAILRTPVAGLAVELAADELGVWLRGEVVRTVGGEIAVTHAILHPATQAGPAFVARTRFDIPSTLTMGSIDVGLPLRLRLPAGIEPYVTGGAGGKRYAFDTSALEAREENIVMPRDGTVPLFNIGVGAVVTLRGVRIDLLVRDAVSEYWGEQQHDVLFLVGATFRLR
jgi:hypothetical protein